MIKKNQYNKNNTTTIQSVEQLQSCACSKKVSSPLLTVKKIASTSITVVQSEKNSKHKNRICIFKENSSVVLRSIDSCRKCKKERLLGLYCNRDHHSLRKKNISFNHFLSSYSKKADVTQIFIFALSAILVGFILYFGYKSFFTVKDQADQIDYIRLQTDLEKEIRSMSSEYKSFKNEEFLVPARFQKVCFAQRNLQEQNCQDSMSSLVTSSLDSDKVSAAIISDAICETHKNIFFVPDGTKSLTIENMRVSKSNQASESANQFFCVNVVAGKIVLKLTGMGKATCVTQANTNNACI